MTPVPLDPADGYSFDELYECRLEDFYLFDDEFAALLARSLCYLPRHKADEILRRVFFISFRGNSWHFSEKLVGGRAVVIIDAKDLQDESEGVVTILHEAGHVLLGHGDDLAPPTREEIRRREDECWQQVRDWLPAEFAEVIYRAERLGGGSNGVQL